MRFRCVKEDRFVSHLHVHVQNSVIVLRIVTFGRMNSLLGIAYVDLTKVWSSP